MIPQKPNPERVLLDSSDLKSCRYFEGNLEIEFHKTGLYNYFNVPKEIYEQLLAASSKGKFFHENIKGKYAYNKKFY